MFSSDTSHLQAKGWWMHNQGLATKQLQLLPSMALCIRKSDGMPDTDWQLQAFTDVYCIDIHCTCMPIFTLYPCLTAVHVVDNNSCIPSDITIRKKHPTVHCNYT